MITEKIKVIKEEPWKLELLRDLKIQFKEDNLKSSVTRNVDADIDRTIYFIEYGIESQKAFISGAIEEIDIKDVIKDICTPQETTDREMRLLEGFAIVFKSNVKQKLGLGGKEE